MSSTSPEVKVPNARMNLKQIAEQNHIDVPKGFWPFWITYYNQPERQTELESYPCYKQFLAILWKIHNLK
jgi:hypothetical protein